MKKGIIGLVAGLFIGLSFSLAGPAYSAVKQYILTEFTQPVVVNGVQYKDKENPILSYKGSTYIPLAKIGELTGVEYRYNKDKKQVEIGSQTTTKSNNGSDAKTYVIDKGRVRDSAAVLAEEEAIRNFTENTKVEVEKPKAPKGYKGFSDDLDINVVTSQMEGQPLPPLLSEGWVSQKILHRIDNVAVPILEDETVVEIITGGLPHKELISLKFPEDWVDKVEGDITVNGIRVKKYNGINYFNISDLEKAGVIK